MESGAIWMVKKMCAIVVLTLLSLPLFGAEGVLEYYNGTVDILANNETIPADFGMEIVEGDIVRTGADGVAIID